MDAPEPIAVDLRADQRKAFGWLGAAHLRKVILALEKAAPDTVRFVGGCVRDSLLGETPKDFDIATPLAPDAVIEALKAASLGAAPTGIDHGTVTAIVDHQGVEITTLRADVSTDGRRASVAFTQDWAVDASRRDFRLNALYLSPEGRLFDYTGGLDDIKARKVRFIGAAEARIREDYLRILRFFRFTARFSDAFDEPGLRACESLKAGIDGLSAERIGAEMMAILALPKAGFALKAMEKVGVLEKIWDGAPDLDAVTRLKSIAPQAGAAVALAALFGDGNDGIGARLRLSNAEKAIRTGALDAAQLLEPNLSVKKIQELVYRRGKDRLCDGAMLAYGRGVLSAEAFEEIIARANQWHAPPLPVSGRDVVAAGVAPGPAVSKILDEIEQRWIDEEFPDQSRTREILSEIVRARQ